jgi:hydroxymethylpyrimidine pyrophosphatase-like HAD family hydrolase
LVRVNDKFNKEDFALLHYNRNENNIDVTPYGIDKGSACLYLLDYLSLKSENVIFIFNDYNDLPLVEKPELDKILKFKVGDRLPHIIADYAVNTPFDVAGVLSKIIK